MRAERRLLRIKPHLSLEGTKLDSIPNADITGITVGNNKVSVDLEASELESMDLAHVAFLGSLGFTTKEMAKTLFLGSEAIKSRATRLHQTAGLIGKSAYARYLFETGVFVVDAAQPEPLDLALRQREITEHASFGETNKEIGDALHISDLTVKSQLLKAGRRTGWIGREELILAAFASGDIGEYAARSAEILAQASHIEETNIASQMSAEAA